jgi:hypothetical protein
MNWREGLLQRSPPWSNRSLPNTYISGWSVLAVLLSPVAWFPILPQHQFTVPLAGTTWPAIAGGLTGVYLLDVSRRRPARTSAQRLLRLSAGLVLAALGMMGVAAGLWILAASVLGVSDISWISRLLGATMALPVAGYGAHLIHCVVRRDVAALRGDG